MSWRGGGAVGSAARPRRRGSGRYDAFELTKRGASRFDWRDPYHVALTLNWTQFGLAFVAANLLLNVLFGALYAIRPGCIANLSPGPISGAFFFSMETLAAVGYGVAAPVTLYGHSVAAAEMVVGTAFTAIMTGLTFVRFSRPRARFLFADQAVVTSHNGRPTLMVRVGNGRSVTLIDAKARLCVLLGERTAEGQFYRRMHDLRLERASIPIFPMTWTLMHVIDEASPLAGWDAVRLARAGREARLFLLVEAHDPELAAVVQDIRMYEASSVAFGVRYADAVTIDQSGHATGDLARISHLEPEPAEARPEPLAGATGTAGSAG